MHSLSIQRTTEPLLHICVVCVWHESVALMSVSVKHRSHFLFSHWCGTSCQYTSGVFLSHSHLLTSSSASPLAYHRARELEAKRHKKLVFSLCIVCRRWNRAYNEIVSRIFRFRFFSECMWISLSVCVCVLLVFCAAPIYFVRLHKTERSQSGIIRLLHNFRICSTSISTSFLFCDSFLALLLFSWLRTIVNAVAMAVAATAMTKICCNPCKGQIESMRRTKSTTRKT